MAGWGADSSGKGFTLILYQNSGEHRLGLDLKDSLLSSAAVEIPLQTWSHGCATLDNNQVARLYINGNLLTSGSVSPDTAFGTPFYAGRGPAAVAGDSFPGAIEDVRLYHQKLTNRQIRGLATQVPAGEALRLSFDGGDLTDSAPAMDSGSFSDGGNAGNTGFFANPVKPGKFLRLRNLTHGAQPDVATVGSVSRLRNLLKRSSISFRVRLADPGQDQVLLRSTGDTPLEIRYGPGKGIYIHQDGTNSLTAGLGTFPREYTRQWTHVTVSFEDSLAFSNQAWLHVNGRYLRGGSTAGFTVDNYAGLVLGPALDGDLDDVTLHSHRLRDEEILALAGYHPMQVASWDPLFADTSLVTHIAADSLAQALVNGDPVGDMANLSGGPLASAPLEENRPEFVSDGPGGRPSLYFDSSGPSNYLEIPHHSELNIPTPGIFIVTQPADNTSGALMGKANFSSGTKDRRKLELSLGLTGGSGNVGFRSGQDTDNFNRAITGASTPMILHAGSSANTSHVLSVNSASSTWGTQLWHTSYNSRPLTIGGLATAENISAHISEILLFNSPLETADTSGHFATERHLVECYLSAKYKIPLVQFCP